MLSTKASAANACSPVADGEVGVGSELLGTGLDGVAGAGAAAGLVEGTDGLRFAFVCFCAALQPNQKVARTIMQAE